MPIDTGNGWGGILLSPAALIGLDVQYTGKTRENYDAFGKRYDSKQFILSSIEIGDLTLEYVTGYELYTRWDTPAFIGLAFLRNFNVFIDYPDQTFGLYNKRILPEFLTSPGWMKVKVANPNKGLVLTAKLKGCDENFRLCLDTGAAYIDEEQEVYNIVYSRTPFGEFLQQKGASEPTADPEVLGRFRSIQFQTIGDIDFPAIDFVMLNSGFIKIDGLLGHSFFAKNAVFIDFGSDEVHIKKLC